MDEWSRSKLKWENRFLFVLGLLVFLIIIDISCITALGTKSNSTFGSTPATAKRIAKDAPKEGEEFQGDQAHPAEPPGRRLEEEAK
jgi:hypothetical protein